MSNIAYLSLGSNLGDRVDNLNRAVEALDNLPGTKVVAFSNIYQTEPVGYADQPYFLNAAVKLETVLSPHALLGACLGIESAMHRRRSFLNAPRTIDIDILCYNAECIMQNAEVVINDGELTLPHPRMRERNFVLVPLGEIMPNSGYEYDPKLGEINIFAKKLKKPLKTP